MIKFIVVALALLAVNAQAAILIESPNGSLVGGLTTLATACAQSYPVHITSALSAVQSNISTATVHGCSAPVVFHTGGSINPTTTFRLLNPNQTVVMPENFGANTTPGVTDMTAAFNLALIASNGNVITPANSKYLISGPIKLPQVNRGKLIAGANTTITTTATSGDMIQTPSGTNWDGWVIEGLYLNGNNSQVNGIYIEDWKRTTIRNCYFYYCNKGVSLYNSAYYTELQNNKYRNCAVGVYIDAGNTSGTYPNSSVIRGGSFELCAVGISVQKCDNLRVIGSAIEAFTNSGAIFGAGATNSSFIGNRFELTQGGTNDVVFSTGESGNMFIGNSGMSVINGTPHATDFFMNEDLSAIVSPMNNRLPNKMFINKPLTLSASKLINFTKTGTFTVSGWYTVIGNRVHVEVVIIGTGGATISAPSLNNSYVDISSMPAIYEPITGQYPVSRWVNAATGSPLGLGVSYAWYSPVFTTLTNPTISAQWDYIADVP